MEENQLGKSIMRYRKERGLSQEKVAEKAGISTNTVSRIEGGNSAMSIEIFIKLMQVLDMDANELLGVDIQTSDQKEQVSEMVCRIANLKQSEQTVVRQTIETLVEAVQTIKFQQIRGFIHASSTYLLRKMSNVAVKL